MDPVKRIIAMVDARDLSSSIQLYGISLVERILRQLFATGVREVILWTGTHTPTARLLRPEFSRRFPLTITKIGPENKDIPVSSLPTEADVLLLEGNCVYDLRMIEHLVEVEGSYVFRDDPNGPHAVRLKAVELQKSQGKLTERLTTMIHDEILTEKAPSSISSYIRFLRRKVPVQIMRIDENSNLESIENEMYENTFKGNLEWVAVYGYKYPVREMTKLLARTTVTPNQVTTLALICSFGAIPAFAAGFPGIGLLLAALFIVLDSLDGKLARMIVQFSKAGDRWDHLTSSPVRMAWYFFLGWHLNDHDLTGILAIATLSYALMPVIDKLTGVAFNAKFGRSPLDYTPLDVKVHLYTVRKNDIALMLAAWIMGWLKEAYLLCSIWAVATWLWHLFRYFWFSVKPLETDPA